MGSKAAKIIIPLVAIGVAGYATGGFGLLGGTGAAAEGVAAGAAASGVGEGLAAGATLAGSVGAPLSFDAATLAMDTAPLDGLFSAGGALAAPTAETGLFSSIGNFFGNFFGDFTGKDALGLGFSAAGHLRSAATNQAMLDAQSAAMTLQQAESDMTLAEREAESQKRLGKVLAAQTVFYASQGVNPSEGSALLAAESAKREADNNLSLFSAVNATRTGAYTLRSRRLRQASSGAMGGALLDFGGDAYGVLRG